jgi:hypothetical protein
MRKWEGLNIRKLLILNRDDTDGITESGLSEFLKTNGNYIFY